MANPRRTRLTEISRWLAVTAATFVFISCQPPVREEKEEKKKKGQQAECVKGGVSASEAVEPATAPPTGKGPYIKKGKRDPSPNAPRDDSNGEKDDGEGEVVDLTKTRSPTDPTDRRKKPFDLDALYQIRSVGAPVWSPDNEMILFTVTSHRLDQGKSETDIYRMNGDGTGLRQMTRREGVDSSVQWFPHGKSFLFLSTRDGKPAIWKMRVDGGEPERVLDFPTGISSPKLSPDGKLIAFVSRVFPDLGADREATEKRLNALTNSPFDAHVADHLLFRHWTRYRDGRRNHILVYNLETEKLVDVTPGDFDSPAFSLGGPSFDFSPDSKEICFASNREKPDARAWSTNKDLWVVSVEGAGTKAYSGRARVQRNITKSNKAYDGHPVYSPDGRYIAFLRQEVPGYEADRFKLAAYDRERGIVRLLSDEIDNWVIDFHWTPDSGFIVFKTAVEGRFPLYRVDMGIGKVERLALPSVRAFDIAMGEEGDAKGKIAFSFSRISMPRELYVSQPDGSRPIRVTRLNQQIQETHDIRPAEEMWVEGADGKKVHVFLVKPHGFTPSKRYPLIVNIHGGPQYQWADSFRGDWQVYPGAGYVVAFPNPHGSIGYGQSYTRAISGDWGGKVYEDIMKVTDELAKLPYVDENRIGAMGWSYGGYMINWILGHTQRFKALASMMGVYDLRSFYGATEELWFPEFDMPKPPWENPEAYRKWSPSTYADEFRTPTLVITGEKDYRVPYTQSLQLFTALRRQGVDARLIVFPDDGHWPSWVKSMPLYYTAHLDWFHKYLGGEAPPRKVREMVRGETPGKKKE